MYLLIQVVVENLVNLNYYTSGKLLLDRVKFSLIYPAAILKFTQQQASSNQNKDLVIN